MYARTVSLGAATAMTLVVLTPPSPTLVDEMTLS